MSSSTLIQWVAVVLLSRTHTDIVGTGNGSEEQFHNSMSAQKTAFSADTELNLQSRHSRFFREELDNNYRGTPTSQLLTGGH